jgi:hypothetical protein
MIDLTTNPGTYENRALLFENNLFDSSLMHQKSLLGVVARPRNQSSTLVADSMRIARWEREREKNAVRSRTTMKPCQDEIDPVQYWTVWTIMEIYSSKQMNLENANEQQAEDSVRQQQPWSELFKTKRKGVITRTTESATTPTDRVVIAWSENW